MRLFVAIFPPKELLDEMRDVIRVFNKQKRNLRPVAIDQMHITLKYIGSKVSEHSSHLISDRLREYQGNFGKVEIIPDKVSFGFPQERFPKHLILNIKNTPELKDLGTNVHELVKQLKRRDTIRWKGRYNNDYHLTLARLKKTATKSTAALLKSQTKSLENHKFSKFIAKEAYLVESIFKENGQPSYRKLEQIKL